MTRPVCWGYSRVVVRHVPGLAERAPKRNAIVLLVYAELLLLGLGSLAALGVL